MCVNRDISMIYVRRSRVANEKSRCRTRYALTASRAGCAWFFREARNESGGMNAMTWRRIQEAKMRKNLNSQPRMDPSIAWDSRFESHFSTGMVLTICLVDRAPRLIDAATPLQIPLATDHNDVSMENATRKSIRLVRETM